MTTLVKSVSGHMAVYVKFEDGSDPQVLKPDTCRKILAREDGWYDFTRDGGSEPFIVKKGDVAVFTFKRFTKYKAFMDHVRVCARFTTVDAMEASLENNHEDQEERDVP